VTGLFSVWPRWLFAHLVMYVHAHSRRSLTSRLASRRKSINVLFNPNC